MPVRRFTPHDFVADVVPGVVAISLLLPLVPADSFVNRVILPERVLSGVYVLVLGYIFGRGLHALTSINPVLNAIQYLDRRLVDWNVHTLFSVTDVNVDRVSFEGTMEAVADNPETLSQRACLAFTREYIDGTGSRPLSREDFTRVRRFGESLLQRKTALYRRQRSFAVFFRNFWMLFLLTGGLYLGHAVAVKTVGYQSIWATNSPDWYPHLVTPIPLLVLVYPCLHQRLRFQRKRVAAFINDLHVELLENDAFDLAPHLTVGRPKAGGEGPVDTESASTTETV